MRDDAEFGVSEQQAFTVEIEEKSGGWVLLRKPPFLAYRGHEGSFFGVSVL